MIDFFQNAILVVLILNIWFNTNAVVEYFVLLGIGSWIDAFGYEKYLMEKRLISFPTYLLITHPKSFIIKILACPICTCTWANICLFLIDLDVTKFIYCYGASLFLFFILQSFIDRNE